MIMTLQQVMERVKNLHRLDGYLFKENKLCTHSSMRELLVHEAHSEGLVGHFGVKKTLDILHQHFFWPKMRRDVERICSRCIACRKYKYRVLTHGLCTPLPVPAVPWVDISNVLKIEMDRLVRPIQPSIGSIFGSIHTSNRFPIKPTQNRLSR